MSEVAGEIDVLHVDDNPDFVAVVAEFLEQESEDIRVETATSGREALDVLETTAIDCVVSDYDMPRMDGLELLEATRAENHEVPFILFTGKGSEEIANEAISAGVTEYIQKETSPEQYTVLAHRIERAVGEWRAKAGREESERMFSTLIENLPGMVYRCRNERGWPMEFVSDGCETLTGYAADELESGAVNWGEEILHPDDREQAWETVQSAVPDGQSFELTYRIRTRDGDVRWCWERGSGVFEDGDLVALEGFITDITEKRRYEQDLERYRTLVENVGDPMYILDETGEVVMMNEALATHLGHERADIVGNTPDAFMPEEDIEHGVEIIRELLAEEGTDGWRTWEMDAILADGTRVRNENKTAIIYDEDGNFAGSVGVIRDISDRKERERELERYETVMEAVSDPVYALDETGTLTFINDAIEELAGHDPESLVGEHIDCIIGDDDVETGKRHIRTLLNDADQQAVKFEVSVQTAHGETIPCELHVALLPAPDGEFRGTAGILRDIEARKEREQRLEQFASVVSHDLRGPLNVILGHATLAMESDDQQHLDAIQTAGERMEGLIQDLLTLARQGQTVGELETTRLQTVVGDAWDSVETHEATLDNRVTTTVEADPDRLRELFENLFRNSVEHGTAASADGVTVTVDQLAEDGFYVADDGTGIPADEREAVFDHGYTTSEDGTGFGLSIVDRIAEAHGWTTTVCESEAGGARFEFRF